MRLEDYWGIGPKTSERLRESLGTEAAVDAVESADIRALVDAGVPRGRAVRILRRAGGDEGMDVLGTSDARDVYDALLSLAAEHALTAHAADRIRVLTPLSTREERERQQDRVEDARAAWRALDADERADVEEAFVEYDEAGGDDRAAVETALVLRESGLRGSTFDALADVDEDALAAAADALASVETVDGERTVVAGADERLDDLRERLEETERLESNAFDVLSTVREGSARDLAEFRSGFVEYVAGETGLTRGEVESAAREEAADAADFVSTSLRALVADLRSQVEARETEVLEGVEAAIDAAGEDVERAVDAVGDIAFTLSLARFGEAHDLTRPTLADDGVAVVGARNLSLEGDVQPVDYAVGAHGLDADLPSGDRVAVLTGANSGGKTTLLETLCQVVLLATMGLPVPAARAEVGRFDAVVFHRRHASFNAGVLESTLRSIVPPLSDEERTLMLVDEFEAITEPGRAADLLNGLVSLTVDREAVGVYVTHLADELSPLPEAARIDGIFAEGLTESLELRVDYQPRFGTVGKSTPEFIVSRLVANARGRAERQGFEALAAAVGAEAVQRTLSDARWQP